MLRVEIFYLIVGLAIGFFVIYTTSPPPKVILKKPTLANIKNTVYVDDNGECYKYQANEIKCPLY